MKASLPPRAPGRRRSAPRPARSSNAASEAERKTLEGKLAQKLAEAEKTIAATRASAMSNVRGIATDAAAAIVQQLIGAAPDSKAVGKAVDASLKG